MKQFVSLAIRHLGREIPAPVVEFLDIEDGRLGYYDHIHNVVVLDNSVQGSEFVQTLVYHEVRHAYQFFYYRDVYDLHQDFLLSRKRKIDFELEFVTPLEIDARLFAKFLHATSDTVLEGASEIYRMISNHDKLGIFQYVQNDFVLDSFESPEVAFEHLAELRHLLLT